MECFESYTLLFDLCGSHRDQAQPLLWRWANHQSHWSCDLSDRLDEANIQSLQEWALSWVHLLIAVVVRVSNLVAMRLILLQILRTWWRYRIWACRAQWSFGGVDFSTSHFSAQTEQLVSPMPLQKSLSLISVFWTFSADGENIGELASLDSEIHPEWGSSIWNERMLSVQGCWPQWDWIA